MCGCGRTSMPRPAGSRAGPNSSTKMNGPTIVRSRAGSVRLTLKSPRSCVTGVITCSNAVSIVAMLVLLRPSNPAPRGAHRASSPEGDKKRDQECNRNKNGECLKQDSDEPNNRRHEGMPRFAHRISAKAGNAAAAVVMELHRRGCERRLACGNDLGLFRRLPLQSFDLTHQIG